MARRNLVFIALSLSFLLSGCKIKELVAKAAASDDSKGRAGVSSVVGATSSGSSSSADGAFTPPADGHLTDSQVQNYIKIRQRAKQYEDAGHHQLEQQQKSMEGRSPSLSDMVGAAGAMENVVAADSKAAKDLGYNVAEYEWVRQQMIDASMAAAADEGAVAGQKLLDQQRADLQKSIDTAPDENSRNIYRGMMADADKSRKDALAAEEPQSPAVVYNKQIIAKYEDATRPIMELFLGGTGHEAEITKDIKNLQSQIPVTP